MRKSFDKTHFYRQAKMTRRVTACASTTFSFKLREIIRGPFARAIDTICITLALVDAPSKAKRTTASDNLHSAGLTLADLSRQKTFSPIASGIAAGLATGRQAFEEGGLISRCTGIRLQIGTV